MLLNHKFVCYRQISPIKIAFFFIRNISYNDNNETTKQQQQQCRFDDDVNEIEKNR